MSDTETNRLIIYVGTQQKIDQAKQQGQITADDFAVVTDAPDYQEKLTSINAGTGISITEVNGVVKISNTQISAEWGNIIGTLSSQTDLWNYLQSLLGSITDIQSLIPSQASAQNQLADKNYVSGLVTNEETARTNADINLQNQIDAITASSDVTDIVGTYTELQAYDTSSLPPNSIIKVLNDESRDNETTYYRWVVTGGTGTWVLIGEEGPYYTKGEADSKFVPQTRTVNGKALSTNISLNASDVGALPSSTVIPTVNDATLTIQENNYTLGTFTANSSTNQTINISVPTDSDYWTVGTSGVFNEQTTYSRKLIKYSADFNNQGQNQQNGFRVLGNESADTSDYDTSGYWLGRVMFGTNKRTFLMGVTKNTRKTPVTYMCGIGAHSWTDAESQTGAAWEDMYMNPDGNKAVYIGGKGWEVSSGWFKVQNSGNLTGGTVQVNRNSIDSPTWKDVACWDDNVSKFNNDAGYITSAETAFTIYRGE